MPKKIDLDEKFDLSQSGDFSVVFFTEDGGSTNLDKRIKNPFAFNLDDFVPETGFIDLKGLYALAFNLIDWKQKQEGIPEDRRCVLVKDWADQPLSSRSDTEVITIRLISREPAKMSKDNKRYSSPRPRYARDFLSSHNPNETVSIYERSLDNRIEFTCWARDSKTADNRALWLERLLVDYSWVFTSEGVDRWRFEKRNSDIVMRQNEHTYHQRSLRFFARLKELEAVYDPNIRHFILHNTIDNS